MSLICWSLLPNVLSPSQRGILAVSHEELPQVLSELKQYAPIEEVVLISTCQRFAFYIVCTETESVVQWLQHWCQSRIDARADARVDAQIDSPPKERDQQVPLSTESYTIHQDEAAEKHLFQLAAGLESVVLGESEIMGQLRRAGHIARTQNCSGPVLKGLFAHALATGRKIRHKTEITKGAQSLESLALEQASASCKRPLSELRCLVIGTGQMGQAVLRQLRHRQAPHVRVINRSPCGTTTTPHPVEPWSHLQEALQWADTVIVCTASPTPLITLQSLHAERHPQAIVDLSLPANVDTEVTTLTAVYLHTLNALHSQLMHQQQRKQQGLENVHYYLEAGWKHYLAWRQERALAPFLTAVYNRAPKQKANPKTQRTAQSTHAAQSTIEFAALKALRQRLHPLVFALKQAKGPQTQAAYQDQILNLIQKSS